MKISIITVTWNSAGQIIEQITSAAAHAGACDVEHIIIDNASTDETVAKIEALIETGNIPHITLIKNKENKGFAAANNQGVQVAKGEYIVFLNPDMVVKKGTWADIAAKMQGDERLAIAAPVLVTPTGEKNIDALPRKFPSLFMLFLFVSKLGKAFGWYANKYYYMHKFDITKETQVDSVRGACMVMKRSFIDELGFGFDPRYFIWFEDVDICREAYAHGYTVKHLTEMTIADLIGRSFSQRTSMWRYTHFTDSLLTYVKKWHGTAAYYLLHFIRSIVTPFVWLITKMQK